MAPDGGTFPETLATLIKALEQQSFPALLADWIGTILPYDHFLVLSYDRDRSPEVLFALYTRPEVEAVLPDYVKSAYLLDPFYHAHQAKIPAGLYTLRDLAPDHFRRSTYYETHYRKAGLIDEATLLTRVGRQTVTLSLLREEQGCGRFSRKEVAHLRAYEPILRALVEVHWRHLSERAQEGYSLSLADRIVTAAKALTGVTLTQRQAEIVGLILRGHSTRAIALKLAISPETVKVHRRNVYAKLGLSSQTELFSLLMSVMRREPRNDPALPSRSLWAR